MAGPAALNVLERDPTAAFGAQPPEVPLVIVVSEMDQDQLVRHRADRFIETAGSIAIKKQVEQEHQTQESSPEDEITSLMDAMRRADKGDKEARKFIVNNVRTDIFERTVKAGLVMKAKQKVKQDGEVRQHGQTMQTTHQNALVFASDAPEIMERSIPETRNKFRISSLYRQGLLKDNWFVVMSRCADNIPVEKLENFGFFGETRSVSIQATTEEDEIEGETEDVGMVTESAFVAGVKELGAEPHDKQTVIDFGDALGVDYLNRTAAGIIDMPLLIPKSLMPNGVIDLVTLYDICAGGTFFGEDKPQQDYLEFVDFCKEREKELEPIVETIVEQLMSESGDIDTPLKAVKRLHKLSEQHMLKRSITDKTINPRVFGPAAPYVEQARVHQARGNYELADVALSKAEKVAKSYSCPGELQNELSKLKENSTENQLSDEDPNNPANSWHGGRKKKGKCVNCKEKTEVGVKDWCKKCIKGHCGEGKKAA